MIVAFRRAFTMTGVAVAGLAIATGCAGSTGSETGQAVAVVENDGGAEAASTSSVPQAAAESTTVATTDVQDAEAVSSDPGAVTDEIGTIVEGQPNEISTNLNSPEQARGVLNVNSARTTAEVGEFAASAGNKLVVIDYEVYFTKFSNLFDNAFRLIVEEQPFSPLNNVNALGGFGEIHNDTLVFEVPSEATTAQLEGGLPAGTPGGLTNTFTMAFAPATEPAAEVPTGLVDDVDAVQITGDPAVVSTDVTDREQALLTMSGARITSREGDFFSHEGSKLLIVDFTLSEFGAFGNITTSAFRLRADDEWYSPVNTVNETANVGETLTVSVVFEIPIEATEYEFEGGTPATLMQLEGFPDLFTENPSSTWQVVFP